MSFRIGADVGGTFTDVVLLDDDSTTIEIAKVLTHHVHILEMNGDSFRLKQSAKTKK